MSVYMLEPLAAPPQKESLISVNNSPSLNFNYAFPDDIKLSDKKRTRNLQLLLEIQEDNINSEKSPAPLPKLNPPYIKDGVKYISNKQVFIDMGVDLFQLSTFIKQVGVLFDTHFHDEISDTTSPNKHMMIKVFISSRNQDPKCAENCYKLKISFHSHDNFGISLVDFTKEVRALPKIGFTNTGSSDVAEFHIFLNTKPENFTPIAPTRKLPFLQVSPFDVIG